MQTFRQKTPKGRNTRRWTQKFQDIKVRVINYMNRTLQDLYRAMENLKKRYKHVSLTSSKQVGGGLICGQITVS